ncbi:protein kinase, partial [Nocardia sp. NPDC005978]|uniref:serine/threonine-protein kinase n=1 Tax=Nocardia sp. NPDC005978 TaxID=3156725 RepID=UPI0033B046A2
MSVRDLKQGDIARVRAALPGYEVGGQIGRGGCGVVLAGTHRGLARRVAIKQIPPQFAGDTQVRRRFVAEARVMAALDHPHVVPVYDYIEHEDMCLLVLEFLPGGTVENRFVTAGFEATAAVAVALACAAGLDAAHRHGILHRDVKPSNLMFAANGTLKLTDFGIAKIVGGEETLVTRAGDIVGTPSYIAPEQVRGESLSPSTDVYALATMLYQLLSGVLPFPPGTDAIAMLFAHAYGDPIPLTHVAPAVPQPIADAVMRGLASDPADRFDTAESFGIALAEPAAHCWGAHWLTPVGIPLIGADTIVAAATGGRLRPPTLPAAPPPTLLNPATPPRPHTPPVTGPGAQGPYPRQGGAPSGPQGAHPSSEGARPGRQGTHAGSQGARPSAGGANAGPKIGPPEHNSPPAPTMLNPATQPGPHGAVYGPGTGADRTRDSAPSAEPETRALQQNSPPAATVLNPAVTSEPTRGAAPQFPSPRVAPGAGLPGEPPTRVLRQDPGAVPTTVNPATPPRPYGSVPNPPASGRGQGPSDRGPRSDPKQPLPPHRSSAAETMLNPAAARGGDSSGGAEDPARRGFSHGSSGDAETRLDPAGPSVHGGSNAAGAGGFGTRSPAGHSPQQGAARVRPPAGFSPAAGQPDPRAAGPGVRTGRPWDPRQAGDPAGFGRPGQGGGPQPIPGAGSGEPRQRPPVSSPETVVRPATPLWPGRRDDDREQRGATTWRDDDREQRGATTWRDDDREQRGATTWRDDDRV